MRFQPTAIAGAFFVELDAHADERGLFARTFCRDVFAQARIALDVVQANISRNPRAGTLRGMHFQAPPHEEAKLIQCLRGRVFDVALDLRRDAPSFGQSVCTELSADGTRLFFIPKGCAHGFLTLEDGSDLLYYMGTEFVAEAARGVRWNDPAFNIPWPRQPALISERDAGYPDYGS
ncbi:MAG TPA: dTDP-4-dehydrorhamnose 3,5-epimerase [Pseudolabrys sp.]|nr:dTDP-4-dehydrorhamnose 3,5-epimerase [Pseudolabrys sp.]